MRLRKDRKVQRQREALERNEAWASLTPQQQLASLDERGVQASRQRTLIQSRIDLAAHIAAEINKPKKKKKSKKEEFVSEETFGNIVEALEETLEAEKTNNRKRRKKI